MFYFGYIVYILLILLIGIGVNARIDKINKQYEE
jgi:hypothetical protein